MQVAAVVLHYRGWLGIRHALDALLDGERSPDQLVVVDNCPRCQAAAQIDQAYPMAEAIRAERNLGYAGGMNLGLARVTDADAVLLLTQDCVLDRAALGVMLGELEDPGVGAVGPLVGEAASGKVWGASGWVTRSGANKYGHGADLADWTDIPVFDSQWTDGCCILLRGTVARGPVTFDERFFMYFEEVDYLLRLRQLGWRVRVVPRAQVWQSPGTPGNALFARNQLLLTSKHFGHRATIRQLLGQVREIGRELCSQRDSSRERARGVASFLLRAWGPMKREEPTGLSHRSV
jgi:GT2 family glycosyltransferase